MEMTNHPSGNKRTNNALDPRRWHQSVAERDDLPLPLFDKETAPERVATRKTSDES